MNRLWAWLGHPVTLVALLVLIVNDHVLKAAWPGLVTGKLSDAAGLVLAPPLLALLVRRPAAALWSVGVGFFLVKTFPYAAELASAAWSLVHAPSLVRADPTDLLTLPFLLLSWWTYRVASPVAPPWVRAVRIAVVLPLALLGVAATSAVQHPFAENVTSTSDTITLDYDLGEAVSRDNGLTFTTESPSPAASPASSSSPASQACSGTEPLICYRVVPRALGVDRSTDGGQTWSSDWRVSEAHRTLLSGHYPEIGPLDEDLASLAVAVHDRRSSGHVVLVANGRDGFAMRSPEGDWERIGFPAVSSELPGLGEATEAQQGFRAGLTVSLITMTIGLVILIGGAVAAGRSANRRSRWWWAPGLLGGGAVVLIGLAYAGTTEFPAWPFLWISPIVIVIVTFALTIAVTSAVHSNGPGRGGWVLATWGAGLLAGGLGVAILLIPGLPVLFVLVGGVPGVVLAWAAARRVQPAPPLTSSPIPYVEWVGRSDFLS